ncbi:histamine N-methyltransferase-like [Ptychodera flava]|uniref:histamine N-methyltransferase-like n=1 Tax=Ptychodera flava TaxID=63121 RepID=UPI003969EF38
MTFEPKVLPRHKDEYVKRMLVFNEHYIGEWNHEDKRSLINILNNFTFMGRSSLRILSIGPANGFIDIPIIDALSSRVQYIHYTVVEPNEQEIERFKNSVTSKQEDGHFKNVTFDFHALTISEFIRESRENKSQPTFDIIHCLHSAYYFADVGQVYIDLYEFVTEGGFIITSLNSGSWEDIQKELGKYYSDPFLVQFCYGSKHLQEILRRRFPDVKVKVIPRYNYADVGECCKEESEVGNFILDFLLQILDARKNIPKYIFSKVMSFFKSRCYKGVDSKFRFECNDEDIIIFK